MNILLIGAGVIGSIITPLLMVNSQTKLQVCENNIIKLEQIKNYGVTLVEQGKSQSYFVDVVRTLPDTPQDLIIIATKTTANAELFPMLKPLVGASTQILTLQNGYGNRENLAQLYGEDKVLVGVSYVGGYAGKSGEVYQVNRGKIALGGNEKQCNSLQGYLGIAPNGVELVYTRDIQGLIWQKLIINSAINPVAAFYGLTNGALGSDEYQPICHRLLKEAVAVAEANSVNLSLEGIERLFSQTIKQTKDNYCSMYMDVSRGSQTEIEAINGAILRLGAAKGVDTPTHKSIIEQIKSLA